MTHPVNSDSLEALVYSELSPERARDVERHVAGCQQCKGEVAWLRLEVQAMNQRATLQPPLSEHLWQGIESQIEAGTSERPGSPRSFWARLRARLRRHKEPARFFTLGLATASAAALVLWLAAGPGENPDRQAILPPTDPGIPAEPAGQSPDDAIIEALDAIDRAEAAHLNAIAALEAAYTERRADLSPAEALAYDEQFRALRETIAAAQAQAQKGTGMGARLRLLDAYAAHRRTMQSVLFQME